MTSTMPPLTQLPPIVSLPSAAAAESTTTTAIRSSSSVAKPTTIAPRHVPKNWWETAKRRLFAEGGIRDMGQLVLFLKQLTNEDTLPDQLASLLVSLIVEEAHRLVQCLERLRSSGVGGGATAMLSSRVESFASRGALGRTTSKRFAAVRAQVGVVAQLSARRTMSTNSDNTPATSDLAQDHNHNLTDGGVVLLSARGSGAFDLCNSGRLVLDTDNAMVLEGALRRLVPSTSKEKRLAPFLSFGSASAFDPRGNSGCLTEEQLGLLLSHTAEPDGDSSSTSVPMARSSDGGHTIFSMLQDEYAKLTKQGVLDAPRPDEQRGLEEEEWSSRAATALEHVLGQFGLHSDQLLPHRPQQQASTPLLFSSSSALDRSGNPSASQLSGAEDANRTVRTHDWTSNHGNNNNNNMKQTLAHFMESSSTADDQDETFEFSHAVGGCGDSELLLQGEEGGRRRSSATKARSKAAVGAAGTSSSSGKKQQQQLTSLLPSSSSLAILPRSHGDSPSMQHDVAQRSPTGEHPSTPHHFGSGAVGGGGGAATRRSPVAEGGLFSVPPAELVGHSNNGAQQQQQQVGPNAELQGVGSGVRHHQPMQPLKQSPRSAASLAVVRPTAATTHCDVSLQTDAPSFTELWFLAEDPNRFANTHRRTHRDASTTTTSDGTVGKVLSLAVVHAKRSRERRLDALRAQGVCIPDDYTTYSAETLQNLFDDLNGKPKATVRLQREKKERDKADQRLREEERQQQRQRKQHEFDASLAPFLP